MLYCARLLTDGFVPRAQVRKLADLDDAQAQAKQLVNAGLWEAVDGGYQIHDYLDYNPSRDDVLRRREYDRQRQQSRRNPNEVTHGIRTESEVSRARAPVPSLTPSPSPSPPRVPTDPHRSNLTGGGNARARARAHPHEDVATDQTTRERGPPDEPLLVQLCLAVYHKPYTEITASERKRATRPAGELRALGVEPAEVERRATAWRRHWGHLTISPAALVKNWTALGDLADSDGEEDDQPTPAERRERERAERDRVFDAAGLPSNAGRPGG
jgi:hypothetical protein